MGHATQNNKVALILMDYENGARLKLLGRLTMLQVEEAEEALIAQLETPDEGRVERVATIEVEAIDWNCPQYIPRMVDYGRVEKLEMENETLREELRRIKEISRALKEGE